ncbi:acyltransferase [Shewanella baltica]|uniref:acyltransferase n=1 Tax=Shewanella baltica TaxID=62322 RepID=UPI00217DB445|nr:acyltransferase [Shewanella baltica]MCS6118735.1 acyltransferase [Shewanella baltica]
MRYSLYKRFFKKLYCISWRFFFAKSFKKFGAKSNIYKPDTITGERYISIGTCVNVATGAWLSAIPIDNHIPELVIGSDCQIGRFCHIIAVRELVLGESVLIADKVYISDNIHTFADPLLPILKQPVAFRKRVVIGDGAWIGENVSIIGASIGKGSIVAAGAVVLSDMPDRCLIAGVPAKVIKLLDV